MTYSTINQYVDVKERKVILKIGLIKILKVNTNFEFFVLFRNMNNISQPLRILNH